MHEGKICRRQANLLPNRHNKRRPPALKIREVIPRHIYIRNKANKLIFRIRIRKHNPKLETTIRLLLNNKIQKAEHNPRLPKRAKAPKAIIFNIL